MTDQTATIHDRQPTPEWKNLLGVCAAIGEDLGFDPLWLRIAFAVPLIWHPGIVLAVYAAAGLVVLASRLAYPSRRRAVTTEPVPFSPPVAVEALPPLAQAA